jgi:hypothetical protein
MLLPADFTSLWTESLNGQKKEIQKAVAVELSNRIVGHGEKRPTELLARQKIGVGIRVNKNPGLRVAEEAWPTSATFLPNAEAHPSSRESSRPMMRCVSVRFLASSFGFVIHLCNTFGGHW